eukprot:m.114820 g.114820  ORF g.114820 m.114820 type:complete len:436 (-) comp16314_c1_seq1:339-1646(-)
MIFKSRPVACAAADSINPLRSNLRTLSSLYRRATCGYCSRRSNFASTPWMDLTWPLATNVSTNGGTYPGPSCFRNSTVNDTLSMLSMCWTTASTRMPSGLKRARRRMAALAAFLASISEAVISRAVSVSLSSSSPPLVAPSTRGGVDSVSTSLPSEESPKCASQNASSLSWGNVLTRNTLVSLSSRAGCSCKPSAAAIAPSSAPVPALLSVACCWLCFAATACRVAVIISLALLCAAGETALDLTASSSSVLVARHATPDTCSASTTCSTNNARSSPPPALDSAAMHTLCVFRYSCLSSSLCKKSPASNAAPAWTSSDNRCGDCCSGPKLLRRAISSSWGGSAAGFGTAGAVASDSAVAAMISVLVWVSAGPATAAASDIVRGGATPSRHDRRTPLTSRWKLPGRLGSVQMVKTLGRCSSSRLFPSLALSVGWAL